MFSFTATFGIEKGYNDVISYDSLYAKNVVVSAWNVASNLIKINIPVVLTTGNVFYKMNDKIKSELVVIVTGNSHPKFVTDCDEWKENVIKIVSKVKEILQQERVQLQFYKIDEFIYFDQDIVERY